MEKTNRYLISRHSQKGIEWFSLLPHESEGVWLNLINSDTLGFTTLSDAKHVVRVLRQRPENQDLNMSLRVAKWEGGYFNFWEAS